MRAKRQRMAKDDHINIRVNGKLKERYDAVLLGCGMSKTDHLTNVIFAFVTANEKKTSKEQNA